MSRKNRQQNYVKPEGVITTPGALDLEKNAAMPENFEVGVTGLAQFSGLIFQEPLVELRGKEAYKRYDEMRRNSPIISALLLSIENPIRSTSWVFSSENGNEDPRLELLNESVENMQHTLNDHISEILTMLPFGYSIFEPVYEQVNGAWLWKKFAPRAQNTVLRWIYRDVPQIEGDPNAPKVSELAGFEQLAPPKYRLTSIPIERLIIYRLHAELDNPEGRSILRSAWTSYFYIKHLQQIEAIGAERDLAGLPVITLPPGATTDNGANSDFTKAQKIVRNVRNDQQAGIVLPSVDWKFELIGAPGSKQYDVDKIINRYEKRILTSALAQFLMLGQDGIGAMALSKDQTDFFTMSVNAIADIIAETFTHSAIPPLMKLNGYSADGLKLEHTPAQGETSISIMADFLQKAGALLHLTAEDEVWLRQLAGMPEKSVEEIQGLMDNKQAQDEAMRQMQIEALKRQGQSPFQPNQPGDKQDQQPDDKMTAQMYAAQAKDKAKRDEFEKKWTKAILNYQTRLKKQVIKGLK